MEAVGYIRVSTEAQASEGVSLDAQRAKIEAHCRAHDLALVELFEDAGISGKRADNRPGLARAIEAACAGPRVLVAYSLSRIARSTRDMLEIAERLRAEGADLVSLTESIDTTTAAGKMVFRLFAVLGEFERDLIAERTRAGLQHKRSRGQRVGAVPRGCRLEGDLVLPDPDEIADLERIRELVDKGYGARAVSRIMADVGNRAWPESTLRRLIRGWAS